ncbi:MAG: serine/threonine protein kinase, partial [Myxococcales bacterium]|nr:serine/threonine protein kinase [Myxococcales bacterium]
VDVVGSAAPDPAVPRPFRVGPYEVATRLARGGMGSVYVCRKAGGDHGRLLTLKVVREHTIRQELAAASFRHEALVGSLFRHPNAQTVIDRGVYEDQPFLILDYLEGGSLADLLAEETRPTPAIVVAIVLDVLTALQAMHQTTDPQGKAIGLVHCDVSPENVLVGVNGVARLADFGSARFTAVSNEGQPFAVSKPPYMPPEQFRGDKLDSRSDIYSTGVLLWTALTGQQPFAADDYDQTVMNVMRKKIKPPSAFGAPACLDDVCMQALNRSPDGRFVVAGAMATALRTAAQAQNLIEPREGVGQWVRRAMGDELARRHRLIDVMFSGAASRSGVSVVASAPASSEPLRAGGPVPTPHMSPTLIEPARPHSRTPAQGQKVPTPAVRAGRRTRRNQSLTERQQTIIALASVLAFAVTVTIGFAISRKPTGRASNRDATTALHGQVGANRGNFAD